MDEAQAPRRRRRDVAESLAAGTEQAALQQVETLNLPAAVPQAAASLATAQPVRRRDRLAAQSGVEAVEMVQVQTAIDRAHGAVGCACPTAPLKVQKVLDLAF